MTWRQHLGASELREIFDRDIAPELTADRSPEEQPLVVFVGAQPGAGKSRSIAGVLSEHPGAVAVNGDDYRSLHPDYRATMRTDRLAMPGVTGQAASAWVEMAAEHLRSERRSVILETTMRQLPAVESLAAAFRAEGYRVEARLLAVPGAVSTMGTVNRFLGADSGTGADRNRWAPSTIHEAGYTAMPTTVEQLVVRGAIDHVTVVNRANTVLYDSAVTADGANIFGHEARHAIEAGRSPASMTSHEGQQWVQNYLSAATKISHLPEVPDDLRETMRRLAAAAPDIIRHTHLPEARVAALETVAAAELPGARPLNVTGSHHATWWSIPAEAAAASSGMNAATGLSATAGPSESRSVDAPHASFPGSAEKSARPASESGASSADRPTADLSDRGVSSRAPSSAPAPTPTPSGRG